MSPTTATLQLHPVALDSWPALQTSQGANDEGVKLLPATTQRSSDWFSTFGVCVRVDGDREANLVAGFPETES